MSYLSIRLLGPFQVTLDGEPVASFESDKVRALLAFLVVETERPHRREKLAGLLWPDLPEQAARTNLRVALSNLRVAIGDRASSSDHKASLSLLCITRQTIQFTPSSDTRIDVHALTTLLTTESTYVPIHHLEKAVELYRGDFLEGFSLPGSAALEEWILLVRERLVHQVLPAFQRLSRYYERQGLYQQALGYARRLVDLDPWGENGQRQVMRLLALSGQRNAALIQYKILSRMLAEELGIEPEDETAGLYQHIRKGDNLHSLTFTPQNNIPLAPTPFVGREAELIAIAAQLHQPTCRLLTLVGPGGSGKTRLAQEAARIFMADAPLELVRDGVFFIPLAALNSATALTPAVAKALGLAFSPGHDAKQQLCDYLRSRHMLLVLDNFEHLIEGIEWLVDLLSAAPAVRFLVTSRFRLNLLAERILSVKGLNLPSGDDLADSEDLDRLLSHDAVALFVSGARQARPDFALAPDNAAAVASLCRHVEGLPLGILLAAAWMDAKNPRQILDEINQGIDVLASEWRDVPERQRSMRAIFDHSWRLLAPREQTIAEGLAVFRGSFGQRVAREVTGARPRELKALVHKSLLTRSPAGRYEMHELLRQYAVEQLDRAPARAQAMRHRHCAYFVDALEQWGVELKGERQQAALAEMELEIENAHIAWLWASEQGHVHPLAQAADGLGRFYEWQVRYRQGAADFGHAIERLSARPTPSGDVLLLLARLLTWQSVFVHRFEGSETSQRLLERSLSLLSDPKLTGLDVRAAKAHTSWRMGRLLIGGDREGARGWFEQSLALYRASGDRWGEANSLAALGGVAWNLGRFEEAQKRHGESLVLRQGIGDKKGIAQSLTAVGETALARGRLEEALPLVQQGCALRQEIGDRRGIADGYRHLGVTLLSLGQFDEAASLLERSVAIYVDLGFRFGLEVAMQGEALMHLGRYGAAHSQGQLGLAFAQETGYRRALGYSLYMLGAVALAEGKCREAEALLQDSVAVCQEIDQWAERCRALAALGYARRSLGRQAWADLDLLDSLRRAAASGAFLPLLEGLPVLGLLLADRGQPEKAAELYALALCQPALAHSRWFEQVAGRQLAAVAAALSQEQAVRAQSRGQELDLAMAVTETLALLEPAASGARQSISTAARGCSPEFITPPVALKL